MFLHEEVPGIFEVSDGKMFLHEEVPGASEVSGGKVFLYEEVSGVFEVSGGKKRERVIFLVERNFDVYKVSDGRS